MKALSRVVITLGNVRREYLDNNKVKAVADDKYDFDIFANVITERNIGTFLAVVLHNIPVITPSLVYQAITAGWQSYKVNIKGIATINP